MESKIELKSAKIEVYKIKGKDGKFLLNVETVHRLKLLHS